MINPFSPFSLAYHIESELKKGKSKALLEKELGIGRDYLNKHLWLLLWPKKCIEKCSLYHDIFSARILFTKLASRRKFYSKNNFEHLKLEIDKYIIDGAKHKPRKAMNYPKTKAGGSLASQRLRQQNLNETKLEKVTKTNINDELDFENLLYYQQLFKELIGFHVVVQYSKKRNEGEIRIHFKEEKDLEYLIDKMS